MRLIAGILLALAVLNQSASLVLADTPDEQQQIVLYPAAEPRPALKYQLLPPFPERQSGNAAVLWNRIPAERNVFFDNFYAGYKENGPWAKLSKWMEMPIGDPQEKAYRKKELTNDIRGYLSGTIFSDMERAAQFESCDWEQPVREGNFIAILLPEIQHARNYARLLAAKAHLEIAEGRYANAVRTLQCGYAEARHVSQSPFFVSGFVGLTIAGIMSNEVQQFIQQPDAPNLYWALSTLPQPLVDFRLNGEVESQVLYLQYPELRNLDKNNLSPDEWRELLNRLIANLQRDAGMFSGEKPLQAISMLLAIQGYPAAKRYLIELGRPAAEVEAMPVAQVILLYTVQVYDEISDDQFKWFFLPTAEAGDEPGKAERRMNEGINAHREIIPVARVLLPSSVTAKLAETRCQWTLAALRIFEAMRLYAAAHDGQWPDRLSDMTEVPIPMNPFDGKPFIYKRQGNKVILTTEKTPSWPKRYEITLMPKAK
jgi:hypothetical protein